jgi:hypothetical protein
VKGISAAWRDSILFLTGLSLIIFEAVVRTGPERYGLLMLYAGMVGLPLVLRGDERAVGPSAPPPLPPPPPAPPASSGPPAPSGGAIR